MAAAVIWGVVYAVIGVTGQRFSTEYLGYAWQLVPYEILRDDPVGSVWNLHIQPPLWNLVVGVIGRWSPLPDGISFQLLQAGFGMLLTALLAVILLRLRCRPWIAVLVALIATLNPEVLRNAFEPTYELATASGLVGLVWVLSSWSPGRESRTLLGASGVATAVVLTRSLYHPVWAVAVVAVIAWTFRRALTRRQIIAAFLIPLVFAGGWMLKNELLFGRATMSSWFGMNLQRAVIPVLPLAEKEQMYAEGRLSEVAMIGPFGAYDLYRDAVPACVPEHDHPALSVELRDYPVPVPNLNYECFLPVYDLAGADARAVIREYPGVWLDGRVWSARTWFATNNLADTSPSWPLRQLGNVYQLIRIDVSGTISTSEWGTPIYGDLTVDTRFSLTMLNLTLLAFAVGHTSTWRLLRRHSEVADVDLARTLVLSIAGATALWTFVVGVVGELGEQARFRTMTDPLVLALGLYVILHRLAPDRVLTADGVDEPSQESQGDDQQPSPVGRVDGPDLAVLHGEPALRRQPVELHLIGAEHGCGEHDHHATVVEQCARQRLVQRSPIDRLVGQRHAFGREVRGRDPGEDVEAVRIVGDDHLGVDPLEHTSRIQAARLREQVTDVPRGAPPSSPRARAPRWYRQRGAGRPRRRTHTSPQRLSRPAGSMIRLSGVARASNPAIPANSAAVRPPAATSASSRAAGSRGVRRSPRNWTSARATPTTHIRATGYPHHGRLSPTWSRVRARSPVDASNMPASERPTSLRSRPSIPCHAVVCPPPAAPARTTLRPTGARHNAAVTSDGFHCLVRR